MDRMLYIGMTGAKQTMEQQAAIANNIANVSTPGFRAQINHFRAVPVVGEEMPTRAAVIAATGGTDSRTGPLIQTGRPLDIALVGEGWLALQLPDGGEAYTRVGNLQVGPEGQVTGQGDRPLVGETGPLVAPPGARVTVAADGTLQATSDDEADGTTPIGRLKLVNPEMRDLVRGEDGLFYMADGTGLPQAAPGLRVLSGVLEGSNVNAVEAMVNMISNARRYEMQMKTLQTAEANAQQATKLLAAG